MFAFLSVSLIQFHNGYSGDRREWPIDRRRLGLRYRVRVRVSENPNPDPNSKTVF